MESGRFQLPVAVDIENDEPCPTGRNENDVCPRHGV